MGGQFAINGQKVWKSGAASADCRMLIARTEWDAPKHGGISFFFLSMKQPGVEMRPAADRGRKPLRRGVPDRRGRARGDLLGGLGEGWSVPQTALADERLSCQEPEVDRECLPSKSAATERSADIDACQRNTPPQAT